MKIYRLLSLVTQLSIVGVLAFTSVQTTAAQDVLQGRSWAASCANCHGTNGRALPNLTILAGMNKDELVKKLTDFKTDARFGTVMNHLAKGYTDEQIEAIAEYFSVQQR